MKPDDIPQWAWDEALIQRACIFGYCIRPDDDDTCGEMEACFEQVKIARALLTARNQGRDEGLEEAAQIGEARKPLYEKAGERLAISEVVSSIRGVAKGGGE